MHHAALQLVHRDVDFSFTGCIEGVAILTTSMWQMQIQIKVASPVSSHDMQTACSTSEVGGDLASLMSSLQHRE